MVNHDGEHGAQKEDERTRKTLDGHVVQKEDRAGNEDGGPGRWMGI